MPSASTEPRDVRRSAGMMSDMMVIAGDCRRRKSPAVGRMEGHLRISISVTCEQRLQRTVDKGNGSYCRPVLVGIQIPSLRITLFES